MASIIFTIKGLRELRCSKIKSSCTFNSAFRKTGLNSHENFPIDLTIHLWKLYCGDNSYKSPNLQFHFVALGGTGCNKEYLPKGSKTNLPALPSPKYATCRSRYSFSPPLHWDTWSVNYLGQKKSGSITKPLLCILKDEIIQSPSQPVQWSYCPLLLLHRRWR